MHTGTDQRPQAESLAQNCRAPALGFFRQMPAELVAVALIDAATSAAGGQMSVSWWYEEVRAGRAPAPVIQQVRCTRWRLVDVARFWSERASVGVTTATKTTARAKKASDAARSALAARPAAVAG